MNGIITACATGQFPLLDAASNENQCVPCRAEFCDGSNVAVPCPGRTCGGGLVTRCHADFRLLRDQNQCDRCSAQFFCDGTEVQKRCDSVYENAIQCGFEGPKRCGTAFFISSNICTPCLKYSNDLIRTKCDGASLKCFAKEEVRVQVYKHFGECRVCPSGAFCDGERVVRCQESCYLDAVGQQCQQCEIGRLCDGTSVVQSACGRVAFRANFAAEIAVIAILSAIIAAGAVAFAVLGTRARVFGCKLGCKKKPQISIDMGKGWNII